MARPVPLAPPGIDDLSVDEKIDYLQSWWDRLAATPETISVPDWHREVLEDRLNGRAPRPISRTLLGGMRATPPVSQRDSSPISIERSRAFASGRSNSLQWPAMCAEGYLEGIWAGCRWSRDVQPAVLAAVERGRMSRG
jgi:hypothetical protein